ncbi:MAG: hypothetical protein Q8P49_02015 [Candidatus Liptonbacteria bacterium]|nr:hypothetical protein [Candidatus Liptonbacteria bacterium]
MKKTGSAASACIIYGIILMIAIMIAVPWESFSPNDGLTKKLPGNVTDPSLYRHEIRGGVVFTPSAKITYKFYIRWMPSGKRGVYELLRWKVEPTTDVPGVYANRPERLHWLENSLDDKRIIHHHYVLERKRTWWGFEVGVTEWKEFPQLPQGACPSDYKEERMALVSALRCRDPKQSRQINPCTLPNDSK